MAGLIEKKVWTTPSFASAADVVSGTNSYSGKFGVEEDECCQLMDWELHI